MSSEQYGPCSEMTEETAEETVGMESTAMTMPRPQGKTDSPSKRKGNVSLNNTTKCIILLGVLFFYPAINSFSVSCTAQWRLVCGVKISKTFGELANPGLCIYGFKKRLTTNTKYHYIHGVRVKLQTETQQTIWMARKKNKLYFVLGLNNTLLKTCILQ